MNDIVFISNTDLKLTCCLDRALWANTQEDAQVQLHRLRDGTPQLPSFSPLHQKEAPLFWEDHASEHSHLVPLIASRRHRNLIPILFDLSLESSGKIGLPVLESQQDLRPH